MLTEQNLCPNCFEAITNPICDDCLVGHFVYWLRDANIDNGKKIIIRNNIKKSLKIETPNRDMCISCGREAPGLCPYCFAVKVASKLRKLNLPKESVEDFEYMFTDKFYVIQEEDGVEIG